MPEYGFRNDFTGYGGYIAFAFTVYHNITPLRIPKDPPRRVSLLSIILTVQIFYNRRLLIILYCENKYNILFCTPLFSGIIYIKIRFINQRRNLYKFIIFFLQTVDDFRQNIFRILRIVMKQKDAP